MPDKAKVEHDQWGWFWSASLCIYSFESSYWICPFLAIWCTPLQTFLLVSSPISLHSVFSGHQCSYFGIGLSWLDLSKPSLSQVNIVYHNLSLLISVPHPFNTLLAFITVKSGSGLAWISYPQETTTPPSPGPSAHCQKPCKQERHHQSPHQTSVSWWSPSPI